MADKYSQDPVQLRALMVQRDAQIRELNSEVSGIRKERKQYQRAMSEAAEAVAKAKADRAALRAANKRMRELEVALDSEKEARASERRLIEAAQAVARAAEAL